MVVMDRRLEVTDNNLLQKLIKNFTVETLQRLSDTIDINKLGYKLYRSMIMIGDDR